MRYIYIQRYPLMQRRLYGIILVRFLAFRVPCIPKLAYFCAYSYSKSSIFNRMQKPKIRLLIVIFLEFFFTVSAFVSNPVYVIKQKRLVNHVTATRQKILRIYSAHDMDARETADYFLSSLERCDTRLKWL